MWTFHENYPSVGPALVRGPLIVAIKDATYELISQCPEAVRWLEGQF